MHREGEAMEGKDLPAEVLELVGVESCQGIQRGHIEWR